MEARASGLPAAELLIQGQPCLTGHSSTTTRRGFVSSPSFPHATLDKAGSVSA